MKKIFSVMAFSLFITICSRAVDHPVVTTATNEAKAVFEKMTVDYKASEGGVNGMMLHIKFTVYDMKDIESFVAVYFVHNDYHRGALKDTNQKYASSSGDIAVYKAIKPAFSPALFEDLQIFMPYDEFDLPPGDYDLTMDVKLIKSQGGLISDLTKQDFTFPKPLPNSSTVPTASVDSIAVDHNITENNKTGMRITVKKFSISGMKNIDCSLAIYFEKKDRTKLKSISKTYQSNAGRAAVYQPLSLPYEVSVYESLSVFIPYEEFGLGKGKFDLRMDLDAIYKSGILLKHMKFLEFQVEL
jgi:hypothetical protein